ncbi:MAG: hypothetical protein OXH00_17835 [Candidatus Poribacteria bacterium]|nr:hypothetical protein [Candidatus Poribacteria bacterium]
MKFDFFKKKSEPTPNEILDFPTIRNAFIEYVKHESCILQLDDFSKEKYGGQYIGYNCGYKTDSGHDIFLSAGLNFQKNLSDGIIAAGLVVRSVSGYVESHYKEMKAHKTEIENAFSLTGIEFKTIGGTHRMSMEKFHIDLSQSENWNAEFRWLRENLEKLYWVLRVHDTLGWDTASSAENFSEDIPF